MAKHEMVLRQSRRMDGVNRKADTVLATCELAEGVSPREFWLAATLGCVTFKEVEDTSDKPKSVKPKPEATPAKAAAK